MDNAPRDIQLLEKIYRFYENWASRNLTLACHKGCAACCTRNVTMTRAEGELLLKALDNTPRRDWLISRLQITGKVGRPRMTTNEWAGYCLEGQDLPGEDEQVLTPCPFLERDQSCGIYPLRPFSCRCFGSRIDCTTTGSADQPDILVEINTVTSQIIEHLGRGRWWGNMLDVLAALIQEKDLHIKASWNTPEESASYLRQARPLPGFLIMPAQQADVQKYLAALLALPMDTKTFGHHLSISL